MDRLTGKINQLFHTMADFTNNMNEYMRGVVEKKKAASKYRNSSTNTSQFSLNGVHRNQGYIGQTSMSRSSLRTPASGVASQGHGGCCGTYEANKVKTTSICTTENASVVKSSVLSSQGMLAKRRACCKSIVKPDSNTTLNSQSGYLQHKKSDWICNELLIYGIFPG